MKLPFRIPSWNFISLHYTYIVGCSLLSFIAIYPYGNLKAVDAVFFGASGSTESGLNTYDVKDLALYQQIVIYIAPIITNMGFVSIAIVIARLYWFEKRFGQLALSLRLKKPVPPADIEIATTKVVEPSKDPHTAITFHPGTNQPQKNTVIYVPPPHLRDRGHPMEEVIEGPPRQSLDVDRIEAARSTHSLALTRTGRSLERAASSMFVIGHRNRSSSTHRPPVTTRLPTLSKETTVGRNSNFRNLSTEDRDVLGGIEYRALKVLVVITLLYFFGLHLLGVICLLPWIHNAPAKYTNHLDSQGQDSTWWAFYSAATMVNNLGFTLTPDSMISFRDATWPMLVMTFLAYAGNTCYPIGLRLLIWTISLVIPKHSKHRESLHFLLDHPRRCYTLLFPSKPTWILFGILFILNFVDVLLVIVLDLDNPEVNTLPGGPRVLAALFQSASSRHTGTATFNLANVNPAVQFSLMVMMYIAIFPIAISIRASNTYEEQSLGIYGEESAMNESNSKSYVLAHVRNQLSFDLWFIFLGTFCICIAEADRIADLNEDAFAVFPVLFEVISAYGNVGLSLGHPSVLTSLSGQFTAFSKVVICAMMIRGRHRMLPYSLDRAIMLPTEKDRQALAPVTWDEKAGKLDTMKLKRYRTD